MIWKTRHRSLDLTTRGHIMGILNTTPDSFSDGGDHMAGASALDHALEMAKQGARIIDIGGESTRPGASPVAEDEEIRRTIPAIEALRAQWDGFISIDTTKAAVARLALDAGADIVNDISGLRHDPAMPALCAKHGCGVVVMHMQGSPRTMQQAPNYADVVAEVRDFFLERETALTQAGISREALCFDPGIGFGKTYEHNLSLLAHLADLAPPGRPLLLGVSRKAFIGKTIGANDPQQRDFATAAITAMARMKNVLLHRVHDVRKNHEALRMAEAISRSGQVSNSILDTAFETADCADYTD